MIQAQCKRYQLVFWASAERDGHTPALKLEFDTREEAQAAFDKGRTERRYGSGILMEWHKTAADWDLIDRYPV